jgi:hypothetical protein
MTVRSKVNTREFEDSYDRIFGSDKKPEPGSWVQDSKTGELVSKSEYQRSEPDAPMIMKPLEEFRSPVDGSIISDRAQLRRHNARHGVTNIADYGGSYFERKASERETVLSGRSRQAKAERVDTIKRAIAQHENR